VSLGESSGLEIFAVALRLPEQAAAPTTPTLRPVLPQRRGKHYTCKQIRSCARAQKLLKQGHSYLGRNDVRGVYASGNSVYVATTGGLSVSTNGGTSYTNYTTADGLGKNFVRGVYASGNTIYAATDGGVSLA
jgi:hypothetical protein